ncbi:MAG: zinc-dependent metalloprotease [Gammaproteobacteria bacterium]|nr:zinc-dependent metalloprotease [Gammaproteobacteria bacterium]
MKNALLLLFSLTIFNVANSANLSQLEEKNRLDEGFIGIIFDQKDSRIYLKIDNIGEELIYQTSLPRGLGSNDVGLDRGQLGETHLVAFERVKNSDGKEISNKVLLKQKPVYYRANSSNKSERLAVEEAFASSVIWGFTIVDEGRNWVLIDATDFILRDSHGVSNRLEQMKEGSGYKVDKSRSDIFMQRTTSFADNTEIEAVITLTGSKPGKYVKQVAPTPESITLHMHHSFIRLPDNGYTPREFHPKSGYWDVEYKDYASPINQPISGRYIARHRLEKKRSKSRMSAPVKPIIYYLDPGMPEPIKSAVKEGALWWNEAYEAIGYKNAFQVKELPENADPMDVRYNVIQWVHRSTRGWSYGSSVVDPRTGEIIKGHVTLGSLRVRQDYLIAQAMMSPFALTDQDEKLTEFALARIRQLSAHEVGHTIGLKHNFAASQYGRESVMDYPHPKFQLQGNKVVAPDAYGVGLGKWDFAAIAYGYQSFTKDKEMEGLQELIRKNDSLGLHYITDQDARNPGSPHANASLWDNGSDAVNELERMVAIRKVAMNNFGINTLKQGQPVSDLQEILVPLYFSHRYQLTAASKWLGGLVYDYATRDNTTLKQVKVVSAEDQNRALKAMISTLKPGFLQVPDKVQKLLYPKADGYSRTRESVQGNTGVATDVLAFAEASAQHTLSLLLHPERLARINEQSAYDMTIPSIDMITTELRQTIIEQSYEGIQASIHQSVVDLIYSNYLNLLHNPDVSQQVRMQILGALLKEKEYLLRKLTAVRKNISYYGFYAYQAQRLENIKLEAKELIKLPAIPPGSPI